MFKKPHKPPKPHNHDNNTDPSSITDENKFVESDKSILNIIDQSVFLSAQGVDRSNKLHETAFGFGQFCQGGNGGKIFTVNRLDDDESPGSFRWAVTQHGPRIIKFSVEGLIDLKQPLNIKEGRITVDGTGKTIVITGISVQFQQTHDIYIKNMRFRPGSHYALSHQKSYDALTIKECLYIYVENVSTSWSTDECFSINNSGYVTAFRNLIACPLNDPAVHIENGRQISHAYGSLMTGHKIWLQENLWAHYLIRGPQTDMENDSVKVIHKNGAFGYHYSGARISLEHNENGTGLIVFSDNVYKNLKNIDKPLLEFVNFPTNPSTIKPKQICFIPPKNDKLVDPFIQPVLSGDANDSPNKSQIQQAASKTKIDPSSIVGVPLTTSTINQVVQGAGKTPINDLWNQLLLNVGALSPQRDPVDKKIIDSITNGLDLLINNESDMGGFQLYPFWQRRPR